MRPLLAAALACLIPALAQAQGEWEGRGEAFQLAAYARVASQDEEAAELYSQAARALEDGNLFFAKLAFKMVLERAPRSDDAMRGLARVELLWENQDEAESWARQALARRDAMENRAQLAYVLLAREEETADREALELVRKAPDKAPEELWPNYTLFMAAHRLGDRKALKSSSERMVELAPEFGAGHFFHAQFLAEDGKREEAERELMQATELGVDREDVSLALISMDLKEHLQARRQYRGLLWLSLTGLVLTAGLLLCLKLWFRRRFL